MRSLEQVLIFNSIISLGIHLVVFIRWLRRNALSVERKAEITLHARKHGGPLKDCAECIALSLGHQPAGQGLAAGQ